MTNTIPHYLFTETVRFVQKAIVLHPTSKKFLIIKRASTEFIRPNTWDIPGGSVHYGELHKDALQREIFEETNLKVTSIKEINVITGYDQNKPMYFIIIGSVCLATSTNITLSNEHGIYQWVTPEEYFNLNPEYTFIKDRLFDIHETNFISDIIYLYQKGNFLLY